MRARHTDETIMLDMRRDERLKRLALVAMALAILLLSVWLDARSGRPGALAQESPLPTDTPTPTATKVKRAVNEIVEPLETDAIFGITRIVGTALVDSYQRYDIHISPAGMDNWQWVHTSFAIVHDDTLARLDTTIYPDGFYDLRSRAIRNDGTFTEFFVRGVEIRNANPPTLTPAPNATPTPVSPLPTPTPAILSRIPGGQGFYAPDNGAILRGVVPVRATVNGTLERRFTRYELAISPAGLEQWQLLTTSRDQVWQNVIYELDTTRFGDGLYDLRLRNVYEDGNYSEYHLRGLTIANAGPPQPAFSPAAGFTLPRSGAAVSGIVDFVGTVPAENLLRWELAWSPGQREEWHFLVGGDQPVANGLLARLDLSRLSSGLYDFRLRIVRSDYNYTDHLVRDLRLESP
jgi:hypothetical protein